MVEGALMLLTNDKHLVFQIGVTGGVPLYVIISGPHSTIVDRHGVHHAATFESVSASAKRRRRTVDAVCGARGGLATIRFAAEPIFDPVAREGFCGIKWPPYKRQGRCEECMTITDNPRVARDWWAEEDA